MCLSPPLDTPGILGTAEVILILRLFQPLTLTGSLAGLAALVFRAVLLAIGVSRVRREKGVAILALALLDSHHRPDTSLWPKIMSQSEKHR